MSALPQLWTMWLCMTPSLGQSLGSYSSRCLQKQLLSSASTLPIFLCPSLGTTSTLFCWVREVSITSPASGGDEEEILLLWGRDMWARMPSSDGSRLGNKLFISPLRWWLKDSLQFVTAHQASSSTPIWYVLVRSFLYAYNCNKRV